MLLLPMAMLALLTGVVNGSIGACATPGHRGSETSPCTASSTMPLGGKVHRDLQRAQQPAPRRVRSVAAETNGKRLLLYSHSGNK
jgi:hypothetical protein